MTEPTTERGAWLEEVRADVALAPTGPFDDAADARACAEASDRVVDTHAPAMLRALEAVEALHQPRLVICLNPSHGSDCDGKVCDACDTPWPCSTVQAIDGLEAS